MISFSNCKIRRTSIQSEIKSILRKNSLIIQSRHGILIGSRAIRYYLPNFRGIHDDQQADWNILSSSQFFLDWWNERNDRIKTIDMIIPKSKDGHKLDFYINCILKDQSKYNFIIPQSSLTYTSYLLENLTYLIRENFPREKLMRKGSCILNVSIKLLLILKKYILYYSYQWMKNARDYRELLTIADPLTDDDRKLCDLYIDYNEKIYGKYLNDIDQFDQENISINRNEFFQWKKNEQLKFIYEIAMSLSTNNNILIGFQYLCTKSPRWLVDYVLDNWISIQNEKFKHHIPLSIYPSIKYEVDNHCLFSQLPEHVNQQILHYITDVTDLYSMQFVCKRWYGIFQEESFWQHLYISHYGIYSTNISWKMLYLMKLEGQIIDEKLINASIDLRQLKGNDIWKLWEDLTHQEQKLDVIILSKIDTILSNIFYYQIEETLNKYSVKVIMNDFEDIQSLLKIHIIVYIDQYRSSQFTDYVEELSIECKSNEKIKYSMTFCGPNLVGFDFGCLGYIFSKNILLTSTTYNTTFPTIPDGFLLCLFIMMIHPNYRQQFINYLKHLENRCLEKFSNL